MKKFNFSSNQKLINLKLVSKMTNIYNLNLSLIYVSLPIVS